MLQAPLEQLTRGCSGACAVIVTGYQASGAVGEPRAPGCNVGRTLIVKLASQVQMSWKFSFINSTDQAFA